MNGETETIQVRRSAFPAAPEGGDDVVLLAREEGPFGKQTVQPGERILWRKDGRGTVHLENDGNEDIVFDVIPLASLEVREKAAAGLARLAMESNLQASKLGRGKLRRMARRLKKEMRRKDRCRSRS